MNTWYETLNVKNIMSVRACFGEYEKITSSLSSKVIHKVGSHKELPEIISLIESILPEMLIINPTVMLHIIMKKDSVVEKIMGSIRQVVTLSECVSEEFLHAIKAFPWIKHKDIYGSEENSYMAIQCDKSDLYHTMDETCIIEILDPETHKSCKDGETGIVVVTDLLNYATPVIRYFNGDYATKTSGCNCGRELGCLSKIKGRTRHMIKLKNGKTQWPIFGLKNFMHIDGFYQYYIEQNTIDSIDVHLYIDNSFDISLLDFFSKSIDKALKYEIKHNFVIHDYYIKRRPNGKFEEFVCNI